jgi:hypothetical protein
MKPNRVPREFRCEIPKCTREMSMTVMGQRLCEHHWQQRCAREDRAVSKPATAEVQHAG